MKRFTKAVDGGYYIEDETKIVRDAGGYTGDAVRRLARFEDAYERLSESQERVLAEMEEFRRKGRTRSLRFRELMAMKLTNENLLNLLESAGL